ncbi:hypothetical protein PENTCL1PPCAC_6400 [Pristionchus entomophagus]|uniref:BLOC-1-related complex subunit 5 n=1 Tax=Pristionchus entomophagus TaxID=358040 RepID=A0AAV5SVX2_9BILA|nr:hypothetical protein PENTCL1PPCAC_6400 [Pristionchus entomophagus]
MASYQPGGQRAFVSKKSRATAADVRMHIRSGGLVLPYQMSNEPDGANTSQLILSDVVDCVDVEEILSQRKTSAVYDISSSTTSLSTPRALSEFPTDDVEIRQVKREWGTADPPVDIKTVPVEAEAHSVLTTLNDPLSLVHRKLSHLCSGDVLQKLLRERDTVISHHVYEGDRESYHRVTRSASLVDKESGSKRTSYTSCNSTGTAGSSDVNNGRLNDSTPDDALSGIVDRISISQMDEENELKRNASRHPVTVGLLFPKDERELLEVRALPPFPEERSGYRLFVRVIKLRMEMQSEPLYGSLTLFDIRLKKRVSETFHFDLNPSQFRMEEMLTDAIAQCQEAAFALSSPLSDIVIMVKLEKILFGCDPSEAYDNYIAFCKDERYREKVKEVAALFTNRLSDYRMVLAVMFIDLSRVILNGGENGEGRSMMVSTLSNDGSAPLAGDDSSSIVSADRVSVSTTSTFKRIGSGTSASTVLNRVRTPLARRKNTQSSMEDSPEMTLLRGSPHQSLASLQPITLTINNFIKVESDKVSDEELVKIAIEQRKYGGKNKKNFPVEITLKIWGDNGDEVDGRITGEGRMVGNANETTLNSPSHEINLTQEVDQLPHNGHYAVNLSYRNTMLLYPRWVNMSGRSGTARNICVKIQLMNSREEPQMVFFDRSTKRPTATFSRTNVFYHNKTPQLWDEIKVSIPPVLDDGHHFLFTFYHVSCKTNQKDDPVEFPLGYSWLPLLREKRLANGEFNLPIALERLPQSYGYLSPDVHLPYIKWLDGHKAAFSIGCVPITTVHPQDEHLERFLSSFSSLSSSKPVSESSLIIAIQGICKARPEPMIAFLYQIMDALLTLVANPPYSKMTSSMCFSTLGQLAKICTELVDSSDEDGRGVLLPTYIHYFKIGAKESRPWSVECREMGKETSVLASPDSEKIFHIIEDMERSRNVKGSPVEDTLFNTNKLLHEELADLWVTSSGSAREDAFHKSFFFLELISKSMAEFLSMTGRLFLPRKSRFSDRFCRSLASISEVMTNEVISRSSKQHKKEISSQLTSSWAFFLRDSLSLIDRSFSFKLIAHFNRELIREINASPSSDKSPLTLLKLDFLRIISSHEHFILLNLPNVLNGVASCTTMMTSSPQHVAHLPSSSCSSSLQPSSPGGSSLSSRGSSGGSIMSDLTHEYRSRHFLLGLILSDLSSILDSSSSSSNRSRVLSLLTSLLAAHETDPRIGDAQMKNRVCSLYTPLLGIVIDNVSLLISNEKKTNCLSSTRMNDSKKKMEESWMGVDPQVALAIAGMGGDEMICASSPSLVSPLPPLRSPLNHEQTRQLLMSVCWVLRSLDGSTLRGWLRDLSPHRFIALLDVLTLVVSSFEYKAVQDDGLEGITEAGDMDETIRVGKKEGVRWRENTRMESIDHLESLVCAEATLTVLDTVERASQVVSSAGCDHLLPIVPLLFKLIMHMLSCRQSLSVLQSIFATQRSFVVKYPDVVFETESEQCGELCLQLLRHCASRIPIVRSHAAASAYLLMRESYESTTSLARVKMHFTMSLSTLVSNGTQSGSWINEDFLRRSFRTLLSYAHNESSAAQETSLQSFCEQVKDLVFNMHMILSDTVRIKEFHDDFEMSMDLIYRIAKGYQNNPDLRVRWLLDMASRAEKKECHAEAAQCVIHSAALVAEYLTMRPCISHLPSGANAFSCLSENVLEESAVSDDVISPDTDGICESKHFKEGGLIELCIEAFRLLERAFQYEMMPHMFQILSPILSHSRDYRRLSSLHLSLGEALVKIEGHIRLKEDTTDAWWSPLRSSDKRCFGTYFRVAFFGAKFGDIDGEEYVYKSAPYMKLSDFAYEFEKYYMERFPPGVFQVIKDSNNVSRDSLDPSRAYLQVTYVEPYLEEWERRERTTNFERNHNLSRFAYATPFTRDGRAHGELKDQYKRRTILTVHNSFPYVKTRLRVVEREERVLSPIEVAIEDVEKKTRELGAAIAQSPPDAKMLQMVLQGCIGTTVNQGPVEVANVFLSNVTDGRPMDKLQNKLRLAFRDFSKKCAEALSLNKQLIHADQLAYQNELHRNYNEFTRKMAPMLSKAPRPISALIKSTVTPDTLGAVSVI